MKIEESQIKNQEVKKIKRLKLNKQSKSKNRENWVWTK